MSTHVLIRPFLVAMLSLVAVLTPSGSADASVELPICVGAAGHTVVCVL